MGNKKLSNALKVAAIKESMFAAPPIKREEMSRLHLNGGGDLNGFGGNMTYNLPNGAVVGVGGGGSYRKPAITSAFLQMPIDDKLKIMATMDKNRGSWAGGPQEYVGANLEYRF